MIYIIELYQCYEMDGFQKVIGYTHDKTIAEKYEAEYENNDEFYVIVKEANLLTQ